MTEGVWRVADSKGTVRELDRSGHTDEECEIWLQQTIDFFTPNWTWDQVERHRVQNKKRLAHAEKQETELRLASMLKAALGPLSTPARKVSPKAERARKRREWMDQLHPGWSLPDWHLHTKLAWETLNRYRNGFTTSRTPYVQGKLAEAEKVSFSTVRDVDF